MDEFELNEEMLERIQSKSFVTDEEKEKFYNNFSYAEAERMIYALNIERARNSIINMQDKNNIK